MQRNKTLLVGAVLLIVLSFSLYYLYSMYGAKLPRGKPFDYTAGSNIAVSDKLAEEDTTAKSYWGKLTKIEGNVLTVENAGEAFSFTIADDATATIVSPPPVEGTVEATDSALNTPEVISAKELKVGYRISANVETKDGVEYGKDIVVFSKE